MFCKEEVAATYVWCEMLQISWPLKFSKFIRGILLNGDPGGFVLFRDGLPEKGGHFFLGGSDLHRNYGMIVILLSFLFNYDN